MIIKTILSQKCVGYTDDFKESIIESVVVLDNGNRTILYHTHLNSGDFRQTSEMSQIKPFIAILQVKP